MYRLSGQLRLNQLQIALTFEAFGITYHVDMIGMIVYTHGWWYMLWVQDCPQLLQVCATQIHSLGMV